MGLLLLVSAACGNEAATPTPGAGPWVDATIAPLPVTFALTPTVAGVGQSLAVELHALGATFPETPTVSLGDGISVSNVVRISPDVLSFQMQVATDTLPGYRTLSVSAVDEVGATGQRLQSNALLVQPGSLQISPASGIPGQWLDVNVLIDGYQGEDGYTWVDFGEGITTDTFSLSSDGHYGTARIHIDSDAPIGTRDVALQDGPTRIQLPGGFLVDRGLIAIKFDPPLVKQGETVNFTITGYNTHFDPLNTIVDLGLGVVLPSDDPEAFVVQSPTLITGKMLACEAAVVGNHDVTVLTQAPSGPPEQLTAVEGFTVEAVPFGVERARMSVSMSVAYTMRDGVTTPSISASATFFASTGACGSYTGGTSCPYTTPQPDVPQFNPPLGCTPVPVNAQYPPTPTYNAGDAVFLETDGVSIRLDKSQDDDGTISYSSRTTIPLESYKFGAAYSIRTTGGSGDQSIPAFSVKDVLYTLNSSFELLSPDLQDTPTLDRYDSMVVEWEDEQGQPGAQTFPVASMSSTVRTVDADTLLSRSIDLSIMTDDGYAVFPGDMIAELPVGPGYFQLRAIRPGIAFTIPGSQYTSNPGSAVYYTGYFELRE